ncbi:site-specific tyrosine recombinase XerD [soil metagenome]
MPAAVRKTTRKHKAPRLEESRAKVSTAPAAARAARPAKPKARRGVLAPPRGADVPGLPLDDIVRRFVAYLRIECGLSGNTLLAYQRDLRDLLLAVASEKNEGAGLLARLRGLSPRDLSDYVASLRSQRGLAGTSVIRHLATVRVFFRFLVSARLLERDPSDLLERPMRWRKLPNVLSPRQVKQLIEAAKPSAEVEAKPAAAKGGAGRRGRVLPPLHLRDRALLELLYSSGLRASEVCTLRLDDYKPALGMLIVTGKGDKQRLVPVGKPAQSAVETYLRECRAALRPVRGQETLLLSLRGKPLERVAVYGIVRKHAARAGLPKVHPHMLRHSFATHLLAGGADLRVVQELLGHADIGTTEVYTHVDRTNLKMVIETYHPREKLRGVTRPA